MANKTEQWSAQDYKEFIKNGGDKKRKSKDFKAVEALVNSQEFKEDSENKTLFDRDTLESITEKKELRSITLYLSGQPMPKQSVKFATQRYKSAGYHTCPWTGNQIKHNKGDVLIYKRKDNGRVDVITTPYTDSKYKKRVEEYKIMIKQQLPEDFKMFTEEVHITKLEFIFEPLKSFPKYILEGLENQTIIKYHTKRPDMPDNLKKLLLDVLSEIVYKDDSLICMEDKVVKRYGWKAGIIISMNGC